jgi:chromosome segregation ATPase
MSDIIAVPTVEQINLEHQLANNKAAEAVQHATNCGLMLLKVKASLSHGEWLPWLQSAIDSGQLQVKARQANTYMKIAANPQRAADLTAPSIRAALELLSDKEPAEQADLIPVDLEAERQARIAAEQKIEAERERREAAERVLLETQQRASEFGQESNERRLKIRNLETHISCLERRIDAFDSETKPEPVTIEVPPADYESIKSKAAAAEKELAQLQKQQAKLVKDQVAVKLQGYQDEVDKMERKKAVIQEQVDRMKTYLESLGSESKRLEVHHDVIEKSRLGLISLAAFLNDLDPIGDKGTIKKWMALADMHQAATDSIRMAFSNSALTELAP